MGAGLAVALRPRPGPPARPQAMRDAAAALQRARPALVVYDRRRKLEWALRLQQRWVRCGVLAGSSVQVAQGPVNGPMAVGSHECARMLLIPTHPNQCTMNACCICLSSRQVGDLHVRISHGPKHPGGAILRRPQPIPGACEGAAGPPAGFQQQRRGWAAGPGLGSSSAGPRRAAPCILCSPRPCVLLTPPAIHPTSAGVSLGAGRL